MNKKQILFYPGIAITLAIIASIGTMPYAFQFVQNFNGLNPQLYLLLGMLFALSASVANTALGTYSILNIRLSPKGIHFGLLIIASFISTIPVASMCFFGYHKLLPSYLNNITTFSVSFINTGIAYTAIMNFALQFKTHAPLKKSLFEIMLRFSGFMLGVVASLASCMAAIHGISELLFNISSSSQSAFYLACTIGFLSWFPIAILYGNSMQLMLVKCYYFFQHFSSEIKKLDSYTLIILLIAFFSATSFAQIAINFFNATMNIPSLFKDPSIQFWIYHFLIPLSFFANIGVNFLALKNVWHVLKYSD